MGIVLKHEEQRCGFISEQTLTMTTAHDDGYANNTDMSFKVILEKCILAQNIKKMYDDRSLFKRIQLVVDMYMCIIKTSEKLRFNK